MKYRVTLQNPNDYQNIPNQFLIQRYVSTTLEPLSESAELTIRIVDEDEITNLNQQYRGKNKPTNVLSFPFELPQPIQAQLGQPYIGDIAICHDVVCSEAKEQHKTLDAHYAHLIIHGVLHLLGYDHIEQSDADVMEPMEIIILSKLGYENPYEPNNDPTRT